MRLIIILGFFLLHFSLIAQSRNEYKLIFGPNITNVIYRGNSQPLTTGVFSTPRSYHSLNYLGGIQISRKVRPRLEIYCSIQYEKIRGSSNGFNQAFKPVIDDNINYIGSTLSVAAKPLSYSNIKMDGGAFFYYAINKRIGKRDIFTFKRPFFGVLTSIEFPIINSLSFRFRYLFGLTNLIKKNITSSISDPVLRSTKPYSFQFTVQYKFTFNGRH